MEPWITMVIVPEGVLGRLDGRICVPLLDATPLRFPLLAPGWVATKSG